MASRVGRWLESGHILQNRYKILRLLGRGGMGAVYLCEDGRIHERQWAVKEMVCADPAVLDLVRVSFAREAEMLSRLRHPSLPVVIDYFEESGKSYVVMEFIEGETLENRVERQGVLSLAEARQLGRQLAEVLDYLHGQEPPVIFRDLKPSNVMLCPDGTIRLVDFGLARLFDPARRVDTQVSGSVGFTSPEQWDASARTDQRSDVFSWGATMLHALAGRPPAVAPQALEAQLGSLPDSLRETIRTCLQVRPEDRFQSFAQLLRVLEEKAPPAQATGAALPSRPRRSRSLLLALVALSALLAVSATWLGGDLLFPSRSRTDNPFVRESKSEVLKLLQNGDTVAASRLLEGMLVKAPADAEAQILLENARALASGGQVLRLAVLSSLSGADRDGYLLLPGLALAQKEINSQGGVGGRHLVLEVFDDGSRVGGVLQQVQAVREGGYPLVIGPWTSQHLVAAAPLMNESHLPMLAPAATDPRVWEAGPYLFTASQPEDDKVLRLAQYLKAQRKRKLAIIQNADNIASRSSADLLAREVEAMGGAVVFRGAYDPEQEDFSELVQGVADRGADSVYLSDWRDEVVALFARQLRATGNPALLLTKNLSSGRELLRIGGSEVEGLTFATGFHPRLPQARIREFVGRFETQFPGQEPREWEARAYDALWLTAGAIEEVGADPEALREYLASLGKSRPAYDGVSGPIATGARRNQALYLLQVRGGRFERIDQE